MFYSAIIIDKKPFIQVEKYTSNAFSVALQLAEEINFERQISILYDVKHVIHLRKQSNAILVQITDRYMPQFKVEFVFNEIASRFEKGENQKSIKHYMTDLLNLNHHESNELQKYAIPVGKFISPFSQRNLCLGKKDQSDFYFDNIKPPDPYLRTPKGSNFIFKSGLLLGVVLVGLILYKRRIR